MLPERESVPKCPIVGHKKQEGALRESGTETDITGRGMLYCTALSFPSVLGWPVLSDELPTRPCRHLPNH